MKYKLVNVMGIPNEPYSGNQQKNYEQTDKSSNSSLFRVAEAKKPQKNMVSPLHFQSPLAHISQSGKHFVLRVQQQPKPTLQKSIQADIRSSFVPKSQNIKIKRLGLDFFHQDDEDFSHTLQQVIQKYQNDMPSNSTAKTLKKPSPPLNPILEPTDSTTKSIGSIIQSPQQTSTTQRKNSHQQYLANRIDDVTKINVLKNQHGSQPVQILIKKTRKSIDSNPGITKTNVPKRQIKQQAFQKQQFQLKKAQDDINLISKFTGTEIQTQVKETKLISNLKKLTGRSDDSKELTPIQDLDRPNITMDPIKNMYISYDSIRMTSTLLNLDIEEMCNCLGWAIQKHIDFGNQQTGNDSSTYNLKQLCSSSKQKLNSRLQNRRLEDSEIHISGAKQNQSSSFSGQNDPQTQEYDQYNPNNEFADDYGNDEHPQCVYDEDGNEIDLQEYQNYTSLIEQYAQSLPQKSLGVISEKTLEASHPPEQKLRHQPISFEPEVDRSQVESILRESMLNYRDDDSVEDAVPEVSNDYESDLDQNALDRHYDKQPDQEDFGNTASFHGQDNPSRQTDGALHISMESRFDIVQSDEEDSSQEEPKSLFNTMFNETDPFQFVVPTVDVICNYCKNILITAKMEKEVAIISLVYIERLLLHSGTFMNSKNWRRITFISLVVGSKIWDDESFENNNFSKAFPQFTTSQINELERVFLQWIDYKLYIKSSDYAKYYFLLRTFAEKKKKSFPLRSLDVRTVLLLQRNSNKAVYVLKQQYQQGTNKSF